MIHNNLHLKTIGFKNFLANFNVLKMTFCLVLFMVSNESLKAQGSLTGKIFDEKGEPVYNAKVFNKNDKLKIDKDLEIAEEEEAKNFVNNIPVIQNTIELKKDLINKKIGQKKASEFQANMKMELKYLKHKKNFVLFH